MALRINNFWDELHECGVRIYCLNTVSLLWIDHTVHRTLYTKGKTKKKAPRNCKKCCR